MNAFIEYVTFIISKIVDILDMIKLPDSPSLLKYLLGAIILGVIFRIVKGGANELDGATNFMNRQIFARSISGYNQSHNSRKGQIVNNSRPPLPIGNYNNSDFWDFSDPMAFLSDYSAYTDEDFL